MRKIPLITGQAITADEMGFCTVHEHIVPSVIPSEKREEAFNYSLRRLQHAYDLGIRTVVDVSPSVDILFLRDVVRKTPMQVVACTGYYLDTSGKYDPLSPLVWRALKAGGTEADSSFRTFNNQRYYRALDGR